MALGVLPGSELKTMLDGVADSLPPEVFKGLITSVGETLSPVQHKALLTNVAPRLAVFALFLSPASQRSPFAISLYCFLRLEGSQRSRS
jgi:hypothetical protein